MIWSINNDKFFFTFNIFSVTQSEMKTTNQNLYSYSDIAKGSLETNPSTYSSSDIRHCRESRNIQFTSYVLAFSHSISTFVFNRIPIT